MSFMPAAAGAVPSASAAVAPRAEPPAAAVHAHAADAAPPPAAPPRCCRPRPSPPSLTLLCRARGGREARAGRARTTPAHAHRPAHCGTSRRVTIARARADFAGTRLVRTQPAHTRARGRGRGREAPAPWCVCVCEVEGGWGEVGERGRGRDGARGRRPVFVHVGQCGAQLAAAFWRAVAHELRGGGAWAHLADGGGGPVCGGAARSARCSSTSPRPWTPLWRARPCAVSAMHAGGGGCGNNWAHGYAAGGGGGARATWRSRGGGGARARRRCAVEPAFVVCYSLGGGTGSGLGSRVLEVLRRRRPRRRSSPSPSPPTWRAAPPRRASTSPWPLSGCTSTPTPSCYGAMESWRRPRAQQRAPGAGAGAGGAPERRWRR